MFILCGYPLEMYVDIKVQCCYNTLVNQYKIVNDNIQGVH